MALRRKLSGSPVEVYKAWLNCCLLEYGDSTKINDLAEGLKDGIVLCQLIKLTTGKEIDQSQLVKDEHISESTHLVQLVIDYMKSKGIDVLCQAEDISSGKLKFILDILWLIILHFEIHSANRAAYQRTVNLGKRFLLEWCLTEIPSSAIDPRGPFLDLNIIRIDLDQSIVIPVRGVHVIEFTLQDGVLLTKLIAKYCPVDGVDPSDLQAIDKSTLLKVLMAAEDQLGIPSAILSSSGILDDDTFDEYAVVIYMAVLRRKICAMKGEEPMKGGAKQEQSPSKPRNHANGDAVQNYSPSKFPHNKATLDNSPLSPLALRNLVDQHTKSHAAIQALQERIQSGTNQATTPRLQKKLPQKLFIKDMAPAPTEGMTTSSMIQQGVPTKTAESFPVSVVPPDHNDNYLTVNDEDLFTLPPVDGEIYTSVDQQFLELMLDAVQKGFMPPELATAKTWLNNDSTEVDLNGSAPSPIMVINGANDEEIEGMVVDAFDDQRPPSLASTEPISLANGASHPNLSPTFVDHRGSLLANGEPGSVQSHQSPASVETTSTAEDQTVASAETMCGDDLQSSTNTGPSLPVHVPENDNGVISDSEQSAISTPSKKVQFLGLDTVFGEQEKAAEGPLDISISPSHSTLDSLVTETGEGLPSMQSSPKTTVTWATLDSPVKTTRLMENDRAKSPSRSTEGHCGFETALYDTEADEKHESDLDDPFMVYLNSIEQTALKFKLQVEQAKVDTLETLKEKLERAYEGTPLEDIPVRFQEKLQETVAQIASDEVLKKYQALVSQDEEMAEEENAILECMRNELDSVASENFALHQQLELLKDYETRYYDLKEKFDSLSDGMATIRNEYEKKNGESEFLAERVESLEKSIVNLRVEYDNEISDLQNENLQLQKSCFELENRNKILEEEIAAFNEGSDDSRTEDNVKEYLGSPKQKLVPKQELEVLELRLEESERQNSALRAAAQADQAMIRCVEDKKGELERSLVKAQDDNSKVLLELHEAQRQISSDRVKLSSYQEEVDALQRENKLLKSSLEIAQNELEYHMEKKDEKSEPWKSNKRMIWREIRELEKILKDVHKEKRNLEKKYVTFKQENDQLNNSLSLHSYSSAENSPEREEEKDERDRLKSKSWHSATEVENNKINAMNSDRDDDSFSSPPRKVKSWLDGLNTPNGVVKKDDSFDLGTKEQTPVLSNRAVTASSGSSPRKEDNGLRNELEELRHHVGSLEAEKAAIVKELSSLRFSRMTR